MRQWIDPHRGPRIVDCFGTSQRVGAIDVHRAGAADALTAGAAEGERWINGILNPDQCIENHRPAIIAVNIISVDTWILAILRIAAINAEFTYMCRMWRARPPLAFGDLRILRQREFDHGKIPSVNPSFRLNISNVVGERVRVHRAV